MPDRQPHYDETDLLYHPPCPLLLLFHPLQQIFRGNVDNNAPSANSFTPPIEAQYVRIYPQVCRRHCTLRMELLGCELTGEWVELYPTVVTYIIIYHHKLIEKKKTCSVSLACCSMLHFFICGNSAEYTLLAGVGAVRL